MVYGRTVSCIAISVLDETAFPGLSLHALDATPPHLYRFAQRSGLTHMFTAAVTQGAALNAIANHWFKLFREKGLADSHILDVPHPLVWIVQKCKPVMIEAIARQYITGSMWRDYNKVYGKGTNFTICLHTASPSHMMDSNQFEAVRATGQDCSHSFSTFFVCV